MSLGLALAQLQAEMEFEELLFWGKIEGKFSNNTNGLQTDQCLISHLIG